MAGLTTESLEFLESALLESLVDVGDFSAAFLLVVFKSHLRDFRVSVCFRAELRERPTKQAVRNPSPTWLAKVWGHNTNGASFKLHPP